MSGQAAPVSLQPIVARAHPNIALVKYWGKLPGAFNRPAVASLSVTLDTLETVTAIAPSRGRHDRIEFVDGPPAGAATERLAAFVNRLRDIACARGIVAARSPVALRTSNNFPTAAGLASSAAGFAAAALGLTRFWRMALPPSELSALAREGSGSAARSLFGGYVRLARGDRADGSDAVASQLLPAQSWPLKVVVAIVDTAAKPIGSTEGMLHTAETSPYWPAWLAGQQADLAAAEAAVDARDFAALAEVTERSCLKMHALALASAPGLLYWQPATVAAMHAVRAMRARGLAACFTVDAGPQTKVLCLPQSVDEVSAALANVPGVIDVIVCSLGPGASAAPGLWSPPASLGVGQADVPCS